MNGKKFKKPLSVLLSVLMATSAMPLTAISVSAFEDPCQNEDCSGTYSNGFCCDCDGYEAAIQTTDKYDVDDDGIMDTVYEIGNAGQLYWFADKVNNDYKNFGSANVMITSDVTVNNDLIKSLESSPDSASLLRQWSPIGNSAICQYKGTFDGDDHTISGLYFDNEDGDYVGLLGLLDEEGTVKNIGIEDSVFRSAYDTAALVGYNLGNVINCYNAGKVLGGSFIGGIVGTQEETGTIKNCYNTGEIIGDEYMGGVAGYARGNITDCYNTGAVEGLIYIGGVVGSSNHATIKKCNNSGQVSGSDSFVGGIAGITLQLTMEDCYNLGNIEGVDRVGGILGNDDITKTNSCYNKGAVSGKDYVGGISGDSNSGEIKHCYNDGVISGRSQIGGILGDSNKTIITDCYNLNSVKGISNSTGIIGGIAGRVLGVDDDIITRCYNAGEIYGYQVGGIIGLNYGKIIDCYNIGNLSAKINCAGISSENYGEIINCYNAGIISEKFTKFPIVSVWANGDVTNCYYLAQSETDNVENTTFITAEQLKSGELAYTLQSNKEDDTVEVWGQTIGEDANPVFGGKKVYAYINCLDEPVYSNSKKADNEHDFDENSICNICGKECEHNYTNGVCGICTKECYHDEYDDNGFCVYCDAYEPANEVTYTNEDGIEITEYEIANAGQLYWFAQQVNEGENQNINGRLVADINVNPGYTFNDDGTFSGGEEPREWVSIGGFVGDKVILYRGDFNGDGYTISGLYVNDVDTEESYMTIGLFGCTSVNLISNINISNSYFYGQNYVSPIVGASMGYFSNCSVESSVTAISETGYVSGLVSVADGGEINNCYSLAKIMGDFAGGLISVSNSVIRNSYTNYSNLVNTTLENSQIINSYYLSNVRTDDGGKTKAQFESGEVASLLDGENAGTEDAVWKQTIGVDAYPSFEGDDVNFDPTGYKLRGTLSLKLEETKLAGVYRSTIDLPAGTYKFVVDDVTNNKAYGRASTYTDNISNCIFGNNWGYCTLETTGGRYTFTFNSKNNHLEVVCDNSNAENLSTYKVRGSVGLALSKTENADVVKGTAVLTAGSYRFVVTDDATGISYGRNEAYAGSIDKALCGNNWGYVNFTAETTGEYEYIFNTSTKCLTVSPATE